MSLFVNQGANYVSKLIHPHSVLLKTTPGSGYHSLRGRLNWSRQVATHARKPQRPGVERTAALVSKTRHQNAFLYPFCLIMQLEALTMPPPSNSCNTTQQASDGRTGNSSVTAYQKRSALLADIRQHVQSREETGERGHVLDQ